MSESAASASAVKANEATAAALGHKLAELIDDPEQFVALLRDGLAELSDPAYAQTVERVSPGTRSALSVRGPLVAATQRPLDRELRASSGTSALWLAQRLARCEEREMRVFALPCLARSLGEDPERSWQTMRQLGQSTHDWIEVDRLAGVWAQGVLAEPFRWAELEQLVYSPLVMERRLVGATLATMPPRVPRAERGTLRGETHDRALAIIHQLLGDAAAMVQKSLSWAIRSWTAIDPPRTRTFLIEEADIAIAGADGHRAWVIRESLGAQPSAFASQLRLRLKSVRRDRNATSTSIASAHAAAFAGAGGTHGAVAQQGDRYTRSRP